MDEKFYKPILKTGIICGFSMRNSKENRNSSPGLLIILSIFIIIFANCYGMVYPGV